MVYCNHVTSFTIISPRSDIGTREPLRKAVAGTTPTPTTQTSASNTLPEGSTTCLIYGTIKIRIFDHLTYISLFSYKLLHSSIQLKLYPLLFVHLTRQQECDKCSYVCDTPFVTLTSTCDTICHND